MPGTINPAIPTIGEPNSTEDVDIRSALETLRDGVNATLTSENKLDGAKISNESIPNTALKSQLAKAWTPLHQANAIIFVPQAASTYMFQTNGGLAKASEVTAQSIVSAYLIPADYDVPNLTTKYRIRAWAQVNGTKPTVKFTFKLQRISGSAGTTGNISFTLTEAPSAFCEIVEPQPLVTTNTVSTQFELSTTGVYLFTVETSAVMNTNSGAEIGAILQMRQQ